MSAPQQQDSCQEVGRLATQILAGLVLLCVASNAVSLLYRPPKRAAGRASPQQSHRSRSRSAGRKAARPSSQSPAGRRPPRPAKPRSGSRHASFGQRSDASPTRDAKRPSSRSSRAPSPRRIPRSRSASTGRHALLPPARPAKLFVLRTRPAASGSGGRRQAGPPRGQVIYDARWMNCLVSQAGRAPGQQRAGGRRTRESATRPPLQ